MKKKTQKQYPATGKFSIVPVGKAEDGNDTWEIHHADAGKVGMVAFNFHKRERYLMQWNGDFMSYSYDTLNACLNDLNTNWKIPEYDT